MELASLAMVSLAPGKWSIPSQTGQRGQLAPPKQKWGVFPCVGSFFSQIHHCRHTPVPTYSRDDPCGHPAAGAVILVSFVHYLTLYGSTGCEVCQIEEEALLDTIKHAVSPKDISHLEWSRC